MSVFYHQPGLNCPRQPPRIPIPEFRTDNSGSAEARLPLLPSYMGGLFPHLCRFWTIMHEIALVYYTKHASLPNYMAAWQFSEYKFRELLAWSSELPADLLRNSDNPHYVQILQ
jgi:hypothetical protein